MKCPSIYYGRERDWPCKHEAGHDGVHGADKIVPSLGSDNNKVLENYVEWTDKWADESLMDKFTDELSDHRPLFVKPGHWKCGKCKCSWHTEEQARNCRHGKFNKQTGYGGI